MLSIENLRIVFNAGTVNEKTALDGVSLTLEEGDFVTVIGGNGAGKSTLLNCVAGVYMPAQGKISIGGVDVTRMPEHKRAKLLGRVFQDPMMGTSGNMWIEENLALASRRGKLRTLRGTRGIQKTACYAGPRAGRTAFYKGEAPFRRPAAGADASHGNDEQTKAAAAG